MSCTASPGDNSDSPVVLATFNARYIHASLSLRMLAANWRSDRPLRLFEGTIEDHPVEAAQKILAMNPVLAAFSVYIWNVELVEKVVRVLRRAAPSLPIMAGGPEMAVDFTGPGWIRDIDAVVQGEADVAFAALCGQVLAHPPSPKERPLFFRPERPSPEELHLPVEPYTDGDIQNRVVSVEASRGCPMRCAFCTASTVAPVRFPADRVLAQLQALYDRGVRFFKFLDRSIHLAEYEPILDWLLARPDACAHFELTPHRLESGLSDRLRAFGPGRLQVEVGVQTLDRAAAAAVSRPVSGVLEEMLRFLKNETRVHVHADLIAGLPGETLDSLAAGFDELLSWGVDEIQLGVLKRLRGTPLCKTMPAQWFEPFPPYTVLFTDAISFDDMMRIRRMARYWDIVYNSGNFLLTLTPMVRTPGAFSRFLEFSDWLYGREGKTRSIELNRMALLIHDHLLERGLANSAEVLANLEADYVRCSRTTRPAFLMKGAPPSGKAPAARRDPFARQHRHRPSVPGEKSP